MIYLFENKDRKVIHLLICSPDGHKWPTLGQGEASSFTWISHVCGRDPNTWAIFCSFLGTLTGS